MSILTTMSQYFNVIIEKDTDGYLVASVPSLKGCHTQAKSFDELMERITEAIELCLEMENEVKQGSWEKFKQVLNKVSDQEPDEYDKL